MTSTYGGWDRGEASRTYLESDRVEVGKIGVHCTEVLSRVAYRDVIAVVFVPGAWKSQWITLGVVLSLAAVVVTLVLMGGGRAFPAVFTGMGGLLLTATAVFVGRPSTQIRFRVQGVRNHVEGVVAGSRARRERFRAELLSRIAEAKSTR